MSVHKCCYASEQCFCRPSGCAQYKPCNTPLIAIALFQVTQLLVTFYGMIDECFNPRYTVSKSRMWSDDRYVQYAGYTEIIC